MSNIEKYLGKPRKAVEESEDTVGTMTFTNSEGPGKGEGEQQPTRVGRSSPSMSRRQRSWNLGFVSDVLGNEGLLSPELEREIAVRLHKLG